MRKMPSCSNSDAGRVKKCHADYEVPIVPICILLMKHLLDMVVI